MTPTTTSADARAQFEAWLKQRADDPVLLRLSDLDGKPEQRSDNRYLSPETSLAWGAWQAALATPPAVDAPGAVEAGDLKVLRRLRDALPTVGLNGWTTGVATLDRVIAALATPPADARAEQNAPEAVDAATGTLESGRQDASPADPLRPALTAGDVDAARQSATLTEYRALHALCDLAQDADFVNSGLAAKMVEHLKPLCKAQRKRALATPSPSDAADKGDAS